MKTVKKRFIAFLLCISLFIPQVSVLATENGKNVEIDGPEEIVKNEQSSLALLGEDFAPSDEPESGAHGSGSYQLNEVPDDYRFYTEYYVDAMSGKSFTTAGVTRRTTIKVYAKAGEVILFGSSVDNSEIDENNVWTKSVTNKDIVITTPDNEKISNDVLKPDASHPNGVGYIANPTQEKNGPMVNHTDQADTTHKYYTPLKYEVPKSGEYTFEFHSITGYNAGKSPTPKLAKDAAWNQEKVTVAAWDVTVIGKDESDKWEVKEGRAWADYLALTTGDAGNKKSDLYVHVLTHDGYVYKVNFKEAVPFGFIFFANNTGFMTSTSDEDGNETSYPIYHSFYDSTNDLDNMKSKENIHLHMPNEEDTATEETYKIFFNYPNSDLKNDGIKIEPDEKVNLTNLTFRGIDNNLARAGHGGHFEFDSDGEAMVTIRLDLRKAIFDSENTMDAYEGSGIVEITAPAIKGTNSFYWDGKDTEGIMLPAGIYGNNNVVLSSEVKRGELHFPVIDMEGLYGGLQVQRMNGDNTSSDDCYNLYYNNNPLAYGTIEGKDYTRVTASSYDALTDGTKSYKVSNTTGGLQYFINYQDSITTLVKDTKEYLALEFFGSSYGSLSPENKAIIDAEFGKEQDTFHFEPVDSRYKSLQFENTGYNGGGNQAGIDAWTYYTQGVDSHLISFALMDNVDRGLVRGQIFYDVNKDSAYNEADGDYLLQNMKVRLIDSTGKPLVHDEFLPCFDESGHFIYNEDGTVKHEKQSIKYETLTDASGYYRFTGVPYSMGADTKYYVQVMLNDVQIEVMRYVCTTSQFVKDNIKEKTSLGIEKPFLTGIIDSAVYGADGNKIVKTDDVSKIYGHEYDRDDVTKDIKFDKNNAQFVNLCAASPVEHSIHVEDFKKIGYSSAVSPSNLKDYMVKKEWGNDSQGNPTHQISDGLIVELWVWNDAAILGDTSLELSRRTGTLMDTQVLSEENGWSYTWKNLDDRLQYYVLEYYTKKKPNGEIIHNDKGEPRKVLIGGTMPIFSDEDSIPANGIYGFNTNLGDYPETIDVPGYGTRIPIQSFSAPSPNEHANSITKKEKLESIENNARQYDVRYKLSVSGNTNVIEIKNSQIFDDRTYYVWLDHQTELPDLIAQTFVDNGVRKSHAIVLQKDKMIANDEYSIKGLSVSSVDAAEVDNVEGNATNAFLINENGKNALFTATNHGNYKTGTGTRTYQVKYVVNQSKEPVSVVVNDAGELVLAADNSTKVESNSDYIVYSWYMTIHVYDVESDGVFEYDPEGEGITLQEALSSGKELTWTLSHNGINSISYTSDDKRASGILQNDTFRLPLYKAAENPHMGSCADLVGIAYAGSSTVDDVSKLIFEDTYESRYGLHEDTEDGMAVAVGTGGYVTVNLNTPRNNRINRIQDHANYAGVTFTPSRNDNNNVKYNFYGVDGSEKIDVFYYKIIVFAEDNTYQYTDYEDIDATEGVVMYTYFTMKSKQDTPIPTPTPTSSPSSSPSPSPSVTPTVTPSATPTVEPSITPTVAPTPTADPGVTPSSGPSEVPTKKPASSPSVMPAEGQNQDVSNAKDDMKAVRAISSEDESTWKQNDAFKLAEVTDESTKTDVISPKTSDNSHILLWIGLVCLGAGLVVIGICLFKRRDVEK